MRYMDGETDAEEAELVERWLTESAEARALLQDLESIGGGVRAIAQDRGSLGRFHRRFGHGAGPERGSRVADARPRDSD